MSEDPGTTVPFDDHEALRAMVSDEFGDWGDPVTVTQDMINDFADLTGDHQWIHVDQERARTGPFGTTIAHGFLTLSMMPSLINMPVQCSGMSTVVNYGAGKLRFLSPVPAGSELVGRTRLAGVEPKGKGTLLTIGVDISVVNADKPSILYESLLLYL